MHVRRRASRSGLGASDGPGTNQTGLIFGSTHKVCTEPGARRHRSSVKEAFAFSLTAGVTHRAVGPPFARGAAGRRRRGRCCGSDVEIQMRRPFKMSRSLRVVQRRRRVGAGGGAFPTGCDDVVAQERVAVEVIHHAPSSSTDRSVTQRVLVLPGVDHRVDEPQRVAVELRRRLPSLRVVGLLESARR